MKEGVKLLSYKTNIVVPIMIVAIVSVLIITSFNYLNIPRTAPQFSNYPSGVMGHGMMMPGMPSEGWDGSYTWQGMGSMMGYYDQVPTPISHEDIVIKAESFLASFDNKDLVIDEFDEYSHNFYVSVIERDPGRGAFEIIIDRYYETVQFEPQSIMWNTKYHMMGSSENNISRDEMLISFE